MFNPLLYNVQAPKESMRTRIMKKHGYEDGTCVMEKEGWVYSMIPTRTQFKELMKWTSEPTDDELTMCYIMSRKEFAIKSNPGESHKDWFLRLGWIKLDENGKCIEV